VAIALPLLEIMSPALSNAKGNANGANDLRLCVLYKGCGVNPNAWDIAGGSESQFELSRIMAPLQSRKKEITVLSGIDSDLRANGTHVQATLAFMTGQLKKSNYKQSISFDQVIADKIGESTPVKSLVLRGDPYIDRNDSSENYLSYDRTGDPLPVDADPEVVFNRLFKGFNNSNYRQKTASVLDQIKESYHAVASKASVEDRKTLEQYLQSVRDVEKEIGQFRDNRDQRRQQRIAGIREFTAAHNMGERVKAMLDLVAIAFWTNTTRVASLMMAHTESRGVYDFIGINDEFHYLSHFVRNRQVIPHFDEVNRWHVSQFNYFLDKLQSYREGQSTLFDNCVVLFGSGIKHSDYHSVADLPLILSGGGGGKIKLGRHVRYDHARNSNLLLKLMQIMGVDQDQFGSSTEPLRGITETGSFRTDAVDDGTWQIKTADEGQIVIRGLLQISVKTDDPNLYLVHFSDGSHIEIRASFGNINGKKLDVYVGSVITLTGKFKDSNGKRVITEVIEYEVH
jgi:hypothetical protein